MTNQNQNVRSTASLFEPFTIGNLTLSSRVVMAPMTRGFSLTAFQARMWPLTTAGVRRMASD